MPTCRNVIPLHPRHPTVGNFYRARSPNGMPVNDVKGMQSTKRSARECTKYVESRNQGKTARNSRQGITHTRLSHAVAAEAFRLSAFSCVGGYCVLVICVPLTSPAVSCGSPGVRPRHPSVGNLSCTPHGKPREGRKTAVAYAPRSGVF